MAIRAPRNRSYAELTPHMRSELIELFSRRQVKDFIVEILVTNVRSVIEMVRRELRSTPEYNESLMQHNVFRWDLEGFLKRMDPIDYVDVLHLESTDTITLTKLMTDLCCLDKYLNMIDQGDVKAVHHELKGCQHLLNIRSDFQDKHHSNFTILEDFAEEYDAFTVEKIAAVTAKFYEYDQIVRRAVDQNLRLPIRKRYVKKTLASHIEIVTHSFSDQEQKLCEQIDFYRREISNSNKTTFFATQHYTTEIKDYKNQIDYWIWKYEHEYEQLNQKTTFYQVSLKDIERRYQRCGERKAALLECVDDILILEEKKKRMLRRIARELKEKAERDLKKKEHKLKMAAKRRAAKAAKTARHMTFKK